MQGHHVTLALHAAFECFLALGEERLRDLIKGISIQKTACLPTLRTLQDSHPPGLRLNTENLRKATPRFWQRLAEKKDNEFASDLSQAILIPHMEMIVAVLNFLRRAQSAGILREDLDGKEVI